MKAIRQFFSWLSRTFKKQSTIGKILFGCSGLFIFCCLCSVSIGILLPSTPTAEVTITSIAKIPTNFVVETLLPTETSTVVPIPTETSVPIIANPSDTPEPTQVPPTVTPIVATDVIVETAKIIDAPVQQVEKMLGNSIETFSWGIGEVEEIPDGGEARTYQVGKYKVWVNYDKEGIAKGLQIGDGLLEDGYSLDQWPIILSRIGVEVTEFPDIEASAARRWTNAFGYAISIWSDVPYGDAWTVRIYKIP